MLLINTYFNSKNIELIYFAELLLISTHPVGRARGRSRCVLSPETAPTGQRSWSHFLASHSLLTAVEDTKISSVYTNSEKWSTFRWCYMRVHDSSQSVQN